MRWTLSDPVPFCLDQVSVDQFCDESKQCTKRESTCDPLPEPVAPTGCGMVFSPVPELLEATEVAAARWSSATGCDIRVGEGGIPVTEESDMRDSDGNVVSGKTPLVLDASTRAYIRCLSVTVSTDRNDGVLPHEIGHCIGAAGHTTEGLMSEYPGDHDIINSVSLELVCQSLDCASFNPEG
jgi:hypothetical protein